MWVDRSLGRWSRTNQLIAEAAERFGAVAEEVCDVHTDTLMRLSRGEHSVLVSRTRSPHLTAVANKLANHKYASGMLLRRQGLPVVDRVLVDDIEDHAQWSAVESALREWGNVVVKPNWENRARGVSAGITDVDTLSSAIALAIELDADAEALVEPLLSGHNVRVSVVGDTVAAVIIERPKLTGDGHSTLTTLIERLNADRRRGDYDMGEKTSLDEMEPDDDWWRTQALFGRRPDTVLAPSTSFTVVTEEAETIDITSGVHPIWVQHAKLALSILNIDVGGVDFIVEDPGRKEGRLLEVNCLPALHLHALPTQGEPRPVFDAFVRLCLEPR